MHFQHWGEIFFNSQIHKQSVRAVRDMGPMDPEVAAKLELGVVRYENELCMLSNGGNAGEKQPLVVTEIKPANQGDHPTVIPGAAVRTSDPVTSKIGVSSDSAAAVCHTADLVCAKAVKMKHKFPYEVYAGQDLTEARVSAKIDVALQGRPDYTDYELCLAGGGSGCACQLVLHM